MKTILLLILPLLCLSESAPSFDDAVKKPAEKAKEREIAQAARERAGQTGDGKLGGKKPEKPAGVADWKGKDKGKGKGKDKGKDKGKGSGKDMGKDKGVGKDKGAGKPWPKESAFMNNQKRAKGGTGSGSGSGSGRRTSGTAPAEKRGARASTTAATAAAGIPPPPKGMPKGKPFKGADKHRFPPAKGPPKGMAPKGPKGIPPKAGPFGGKWPPKPKGRFPSKIPSPDDPKVKEIQEKQSKQFTLMDTNQDGNVSVDEMEAIKHKLLERRQGGETMDEFESSLLKKLEKDHEKFYNNVDTNKDGTLEWLEYKYTPRQTSKEL